MYVSKTTAAERLTIASALDDVFISLDRAHYLLSEVKDSFFGDLEQKPIAAYDAEGIAVKLEIAEGIIFDAMLAYALTVGRGDFRGVSPHLESAERAALAVKVERQLTTAFHGVARTEERKRIMALPDEQATAILDTKEVAG